MVRATRDALLKALDNLTETSFKRFCYKLSDLDIKEDFRKIPRIKLENKDREDVVDLILSHYMDSYGAELTVNVLESISEKQVAWDLKKDLENELKRKEHFVDEHCVELIQRIHQIEPILDGLMARGLLTDEQCDTIRGERTSQDKMRTLYSLIRGWSNTDKDILYNLLNEHNPSLIRDLEERELTRKKRFVDEHCVELIQRIHQIDPVLDGLMTRGLLTFDKCDTIRGERTSQEKMRTLYSLIRGWSNTDKGILYNFLNEHNPSLIRDLEERELKRKEHFVDEHCVELIQRIHQIEPVLDGLMARGLLTFDKCDTIRGKRTTREKMRSVYSLIRGWSNTDKDILYKLLNEHNPSLIRDLEERELTRKKHFVDEHCVELIQRIHQIDPVLDGLKRRDLLTRDKYFTICGERTSQEKMRTLYSLIRGWSNTDKDILYKLLNEHNPSVIRDLEERELKRKEHFVDEHCVELIQRIHQIDPVLDGLMRRDLLTRDKYFTICGERTPQDKMRTLYSLIRGWSNTDKDILYKLLNEHNPSVIRDLEERGKSHHYFTILCCVLQRALHLHLPCYQQ
ncbi:uncharacterized protein LOC143925640 [Lithobates pipiens]